MERIDLARLDLNLLVAFDQIATTGSVTRAARALHITQPAMSRTLQRLRYILGDVLFVRQGRSLVPTERAKALVEPVQDALAAARRVFVVPGPFDPLTARGELTIALGDDAQVGFVDAILGRLWREAPGIDVRVRRLSMDTVEEGRRGVIDLAVTPDGGALPRVQAPDLSDFVVRRLYKRRFVVISSPRYPRPNISLEAYAAADHLISALDGSGRAFMDDLLEARGLKRRVAATVTSFGSAASVVAATALIATLPEEVVWTSGLPLVVSPPPIPLPALDVMLVWHPRVGRDPRHQFLREVVADAIATRAHEWGVGNGAVAGEQ